MKGKISDWLGLVPAAVIALCVFSSLSGYVKPVFEEPKVSAKTDSEDSTQSQSDTAERPDSSKHNEESSFDIVEDNSDDKSSDKYTINEKNAVYKDGKYIGEGDGFDGKIKVRVTIAQGKISDIKILSHSDGAEFIKKASALLDRIIEGQSTEVDVVSGATYSSNGIISAVRDALKKAAVDPESVPDADAESKSQGGEKDSSNDQSPYSSSKEDDPKNGGGDTQKNSDVSDEQITYKDGVYTGEGNGFAGSIKVSVTIKNGKIYDIKILSHSDGTEFMEKAVTLLKKIIKQQNTDVDTVSGATYSSNGIISAVRDALKKAAVKTSKKSNSSAPDTKKSTNTGSNKGANTKTTDKNTSVADKTIKGKFPYKDGVYLGTGEGFRGDVTVAVSIKNKTINTILVIDYEDDDSFFNRAKALIDNILKKQTVKVDTISGATFSSKGILEAVEDALNNAKKASSSGKKNSENSKDDSSKVSESISQSSDDSADESKDDSSEVREEELKYRDGTYTASAVCLPDDNDEFDAYELKVTVTIKSDKITEIENISENGGEDNDYYISRAAVGTKKYTGVVSQLLGQSGDLKIDTVSGATCSSKAILKAVENALKSALKD